MATFAKLDVPKHPHTDALVEREYQVRVIYDVPTRLMAAGTPDAVLVEWLEGPRHEQREWMNGDRVRAANPDEETL